ncbi:hypothetical protein B0H10DRAFT_2227849 [Mycena sp. CBHHK59/15]|nr:hypothetical protein B0H10DRAFT_2227849 [Mycena sp. CBHHK59/15]
MSLQPSLSLNNPFLDCAATGTPGPSGFSLAKTCTHPTNLSTLNMRHPHTRLHWTSHGHLFVDITSISRARLTHTVFSTHTLRPRWRHFSPPLLPLPLLTVHHLVVPPLLPRPQPHQSAYHKSSQDLASSTSAHFGQRLCLEHRNWIPFSVKVQNQLGMVFPGARQFIEPEDNDPNICPSFQHHPAHYRAWKNMDQVMRSFLSDVCAPTERIHIQGLLSAKDTWRRSATAMSSLVLLVSSRR